MSTLPSSNDVRAEYLKIRTLRLPVLVLLAGTVFSGAIGVGGVLMQKAGATVDVTQAARAVTAPMWFLVAVIAILTSAGEFQHHTIRSTLLTTPRRADVLISKALVMAGYGAAMTGLGMAASIGAVLVTGHLDGVPLHAGGPAAWSGLAGAVLAGALVAMLASALGMLARGTALAISALLLWYFVGEAVLPVLLRQPGISNWTPTGVATTLVDPASQELATVVASGAGLLGYAAIFSAAATWMFLRRDPD
jgi:ABC-2 type transport system permease protein